MFASYSDVSSFHAGQKNHLDPVGKGCLQVFMGSTLFYSHGTMCNLVFVLCSERAATVAWKWGEKASSDLRGRGNQETGYCNCESHGDTKQHIPSVSAPAELKQCSVGVEVKRETIVENIKKSYSLRDAFPFSDEDVTSYPSTPGNRTERQTCQLAIGKKSMSYF